MPLPVFGQKARPPRLGLSRGQIIIAAAVFVGSLIAGNVAYIKASGADKPAPAPPQTSVAHVGTLTSTVDVTGNLVAAADLQLNFETSGKVNKVLVKSGDKVTKGQVLATIDPTDLQSAVDQAQQNLDSANVKLQQLYDAYTDADVARRDKRSPAPNSR